MFEFEVWGAGVADTCWDRRCGRCRTRCVEVKCGADVWGVRCDGVKRGDSCRCLRASVGVGCSFVGVVELRFHLPYALDHAVDCDLVA